MDTDEKGKRLMDLVLNGKHDTNFENIYKPRNDDIIVIGPPKSGTTWVQQIVHQLRTKGDESFRDIYDVTWWIPPPKLQLPFDINGDQGFNQRVYKHHEVYGVIETTERQKKIVIVRNPYDAVYSWAKFINGFFGGDNDISDDNLALMLKAYHDGNAITNFKCVASWWPHRNDPDVLFLYYEDLKHDLQGKIEEIAQFLNIPLTKDELHRITYFSSFEYMNANKEKFKGNIPMEMIASGIGADPWSTKIGMVRDGTMGQGKHLGPKLKALVDELWKETIADNLGLMSYDDMYRAH